jgi:hypothetical protein
MSSNPAYRDQVSLLLRLLPIVAREKEFALKGGTAINLFVRDLPRLSVDIDLTFLPLSDRPAALAAIRDGMARLARSITQLIPRARVQMSANPVSPKLVVSSDRARVKIEPNSTLAGNSCRWLTWLNCLQFDGRLPTCSNSRVDRLLTRLR